MADQVVDGVDTPCGYQQVTDLSASVGLTVPASATRALIVAESQAVRYSDFSTPTASVGMPLAVGQPLWYTGSLTALRFIEQTASAKLNVLFYG